MKCGRCGADCVPGKLVRRHESRRDDDGKYHWEPEKAIGLITNTCARCWALEQVENGKSPKCIVGERTSTFAITISSDIFHRDLTDEQKIRAHQDANHIVTRLGLFLNKLLNSDPEWKQKLEELGPGWKDKS